MSKRSAVIILLLLTCCGKYTPQFESEHKADTASTVEVEGESTSTIITKTDFDTILQICEVKTGDKVVPFSQWTDKHRECFEYLKLEEVTP